MFYFITNDLEVILKCRWAPRGAVSSAVGSWWSLGRSLEGKGGLKGIWRTNK